MILQTIDVQRFTSSFDGRFHYYKQTARGSGPAIDNAFRGEQQATGYPILDLPRGNNDNNSWTLGPKQSATFKTADSPFVQAPIGNSNLQAGKLKSASNPDGRPESFVTYVMCRPEDSLTGKTVWVALAKVSWGWSAAAKNDGNGSWGLEGTPSVVPPVSTANLPEADWFPSWTDRGSDILGRGWKEY